MTVNTLADKALISILKMIAEVNRHKDMADYQQDRRLQKHLPGYRVRLNFGLHAGWAIEGAIGSRHKLDLAYLGANVKVTRDLVKLSNIYNVPLALSGVLYSLLSPNVKYHCRLMDVVRILEPHEEDMLESPLSVVSKSTTYVHLFASLKLSFHQSPILGLI
jgi:class 3 adenylate cyclase